MNADTLRGAIKSVRDLITEKREELITLDQQNGDGDLGISMSEGFNAVSEYLKSTDEHDLCKLLTKCSNAFNEAAPSSMGTILSFGMMGMAKALKGKTKVTLYELADAMQAGLSLIMDKAKSKLGEKTVLDALHPAIVALKENTETDKKTAFALAAKAAAEGSENTRNMRSVHGRAAYYGDKSIGVVDGGSVVGRYIFEALYNYVSGTR